MNADELGARLRRAGIEDVGLVTLPAGMDRPFHGFSVPGEQALPLWRRLRQAVPVTGHWPVVIGDESQQEHLTESLEDPAEEREKAIEKALNIDAAAWLRGRLQELDTGRAEDDLPGYLADVRGPWPDGDQPATRLWAAGGGDGGWHQEVHIILLPTVHGWEAPAWLAFGGWNECPLPSEHVALLRSWEERYGAECAAVTGDTIELTVAAPIRTRETALAVAEEQFIYCEDIVAQGTRTLEGLAASILDGMIWFFWWD